MPHVGRNLVLGGIVMIVAVYSPDKSFGYAIGVGLILLGLCVLTSNGVKS